MYGWQKNGWVTSKKEPVLNQDLWQQLFDIKPVFSSITINHVRGHVGIPGNERADDLATTAADEGVLNLYRGNRNSYPVDLSSNTISNKKPGAKSGKAFCYLSMVGGVIQEHKTWAECQARVKGKSRPKFRKATSLAERDQIIKSWQSEQVT